MSEPKHIADVFRTISPADWAETFKLNRPRANKLSQSIHEHLCPNTTDNPPIQRELKDGPALDTRKQEASPGGNGQLRESNPSAGLADEAQNQQA